MTQRTIKIGSSTMGEAKKKIDDFLHKSDKIKKILNIEPYHDGSEMGVMITYQPVKGTEDDS